MNSNKLPEQCIIIGSFGIALSIVAIMSETMDLWINLHADYSEELRSTYVVKENATRLAFYVAAALFSILLVRGVLKKNLVLMAPWLISAFLGVALSIFLVIPFLLYLPFHHLDLLLLPLALAGVETLVLYPLCSLCRDIWHEKSEAKRQQHQFFNPYDKNEKFVSVDLPSKGIK